jgi:hypothetical protein
MPRDSLRQAPQLPEDILQLLSLVDETAVGL